LQARGGRGQAVAEDWSSFIVFVLKNTRQNDLPKLESSLVLSLRSV